MQGSSWRIAPLDAPSPRARAAAPRRPRWRARRSRSGRPAARRRRCRPARAPRPARRSWRRRRARRPWCRRAGRARRRAGSRGASRAGPQAVRDGSGELPGRQADARGAARRSRAARCGRAPTGRRCAPCSSRAARAARPPRRRGAPSLNSSRARATSTASSARKPSLGWRFAICSARTGPRQVDAVELPVLAHVADEVGELEGERQAGERVVALARRAEQDGEDAPDRARAALHVALELLPRAHPDGGAVDAHRVEVRVELAAAGGRGGGRRRRAR